MDIVVGSEQAHLLAREGDEEQAPLRPVAPRREILRQLDDTGGARSIVIGAGVNLRLLGRAQRAGPAHPEVVVVRADYDPFVLQVRV